MDEYEEFDEYGDNHHCHKRDLDEEYADDEDDDHHCHKFASMMIMMTCMMARGDPFTLDCTLHIAQL